MALATGVIAREGSTARRVYDENINGGIHKVHAICQNEVLAELGYAGGTVLWILPNENGGLTLMFPEDY